jgi:DNA-binding transcriptional MerR regulator
VTDEQKELLAAYAAGDMDRVEFFELALDAGLTIAQIDEAMKQEEDF